MTAHPKCPSCGRAMQATGPDRESWFCNAHDPFVRVGREPKYRQEPEIKPYRLPVSEMTRFDREARVIEAARDFVGCLGRTCPKCHDEIEGAECRCAFDRDNLDRARERLVLSVWGLG